MNLFYQRVVPVLILPLSLIVEENGMLRDEKVSRSRTAFGIRKVPVPGSLRGLRGFPKGVEVSLGPGRVATSEIRQT